MHGQAPSDLRWAAERLADGPDTAMPAARPGGISLASGTSSGWRLRIAGTQLGHYKTASEAWAAYPRALAINALHPQRPRDGPPVAARSPMDGLYVLAGATAAVDRNEPVTEQLVVLRVPLGAVPGDRCEYTLPAGNVARSFVVPFTSRVGDLLELVDGVARPTSAAAVGLYEGQQPGWFWRARGHACDWKPFDDNQLDSLRPPRSPWFVPPRARPPPPPPPPRPTYWSPPAPPPPRNGFSWPLGPWQG